MEDRDIYNQLCLSYWNFITQNILAAKSMFVFKYSLSSFKIYSGLGNPEDYKEYYV